MRKALVLFVITTLLLIAGVTAYASQAYRRKPYVEEYGRRRYDYGVVTTIKVTIPQANWSSYICITNEGDSGTGMWCFPHEDIAHANS